MPGLLLLTGYFAVMVFIVTSMLAMGLNISICDLISPLRNRRLVILSLLANFVIVPLFAFVLIYVFPVSRDLAAGLILVSIAAGAPSTPKVAELTEGNIAYAVSLTLLMTILTIILMPILVPYIMEGMGMNPAKVAFNLVIFMLLPILVGMLLRNRAPERAQKILPLAELVSNASIGVIFLAFGIIFFAHVVDLFGHPGGFEIAAIAVLFTVGALLIGYFMGGPERGHRDVLAFSTGFRNITAALVVITASYSDLDNDVFLMVLMITLFSVIIVSAIVGIIIKKRIDTGKQSRLQPS